MDEELISVCALTTREACLRTTPQNLKALHDSVDQACRLSAKFDWDRKAAAHAQIVALLAETAGDPVLAFRSGNAPGWLHDLMVTVGPAAGGIVANSRRRLLALIRAGDAEGAADEMEKHLRGLLWMRRVTRVPAPIDTAL
jgi:DNA-binding FadR family transcriptional regulator